MTMTDKVLRLVGTYPAPLGTLELVGPIPAERGTAFASDMAISLYPGRLCRRRSRRGYPERLHHPRHNFQPALLLTGFGHQ